MSETKVVPVEPLSREQIEKWREVFVVYKMPEPTAICDMALASAALERALEDLVQLKRLWDVSEPQHLSRLPTYMKQIMNDPAWEAARQLLAERPAKEGK